MIAVVIIVLAVLWLPRSSGLASVPPDPRTSRSRPMSTLSVCSVRSPSAPSREAFHSAPRGNRPCPRSKAHRSAHPGPVPPREPQERTLPTQPPQAPKRLPPAGEPKLRFSKPARPSAGGIEHGPSESVSQEAESGPSLVERRRAKRSSFSYTGPSTGHRPESGPADHLQLGGGAPPSGDDEEGGDGRSCCGCARGRHRRVDLSGQQRRWAQGSVGQHDNDYHHDRNNSGGGRTTTTTTTTTTLPTTLKPTSVSPVTFAVPSGGYTLCFPGSGGSSSGRDRAQLGGTMAVLPDHQRRTVCKLQGIGCADRHARRASLCQPQRGRSHGGVAEWVQAGI